MVPVGTSGSSVTVAWGLSGGGVSNVVRVSWAGTMGKFSVLKMKRSSGVDRGE